MSTVKIIVATHKPYRMPDDPIYFPLHVGSAGKADIGYPGDDTGENISLRNGALCELTGLYWAWKNLDADFIGLVHYRRHFTAKPIFARLGRDRFESILSGKELEGILCQYDMVLPKKRNYYIETLRSHFVHLPYTFEKDLRILQEVIHDKQPDYEQAFKCVMVRRSAHMFNMFIMKRETFNRYCQWLFSILLEVDRRLDVTGYTPMEARAAAYFGEFMFDVWNEKHQIPYYELPVLFMEKQNYLVKVGRFLMRKFFSKQGNGEK